jgi:hypothetical protein
MFLIANHAAKDRTGLLENAIGYADYGIIPQPHFSQRILSATKRPMLDSTMVRVPVFDATISMLSTYTHP